MPRLFPDLRCGRLLVRLRVGRVAELVDEMAAGDLARQAFGDVAVILGMALADVRAGHHHVRPHRLQVKDLLLAHLVGDDQQQPIALLCRDQRQPQAGVAGRGLDQRATGLEGAGALGGLNEIQADAILDRAARILVLELQEQLARPGIHTAHRHQRRVADHLQYTAVSGIRHARALRGRSAIVRHGGCAPALAQATPLMSPEPTQSRSNAAACAGACASPSSSHNSSHSSPNGQPLRAASSTALSVCVSERK